MDFLTVVAPVIASLSAIVGLLVGVEQITTGARLRRESTFWRESQQSATRKHDHGVLESLHRTATARIIAIKMIPARLLLLNTIIIVNGIAIIFLAAHSAGEILPNPITFDALWATQEIDPVLPAMVPVVVFGGLVGAASFFVRRRRVIRLYLDGEDVSGLPMQFTDSGRMDVGLHLGARQWAAVGSLSIGLCGLAAFSGFAAGAGTENLGSVQPWIAIWFFVSMAFMVFGFSAISFIYGLEREAPVHPRILKPNARVSASDLPAAPSPQRSHVLWRSLISRVDMSSK